MESKNIKKKDNTKTRFLISILLFITGLTLYYAAWHSVSFADFFHETIYKAVSGLLARIFSIFPFSVSEILLYSFILLVITRLIRFICRLVSRKVCMAAELKILSTKLLFLSSVLFFIYVVNCGINYHHTSFAEQINLQEISYSSKELKEVCLYLTGEINQRERLVDRNSDGLFQASSYREETRKAMTDLGSSISVLNGFYPGAKPVVMSRFLSYLNLTGIYSPFTIEANYNKDMPEFYIPFTICHELSHLKGYMQEEEANFIGYLACIRSGDRNLEYSGYLAAYIYVINELWNYNAVLADEVSAGLGPLARKDLAADSAYWSRYTGPIGELSSKINDTYLKANSQTDGANSYDRVTALILADFYR